MDLTAQNSKTELTAGLQAEYLREFENISAEVLQTAFRQWRRQSKFWPTVSEIHETVTVIQRVRRAEAEDAARAEEKTLLAKAREDGNLLDFGDMKAAIAKIAQAAGKNSPSVRELAKPMPDYKPLSKQELERRRQDQLARLAQARKVVP